MPGKGSDLFDDVLEDDLGGRASTPQRRVGGASLHADEFAAPRVTDELDSRFHRLQAEEAAMRTMRAQSGNTRRTRWTGTLWLLAAFAGIATAALGWSLHQGHAARANQEMLLRANAARRQAEEERLLRLQQVGPARPASKTAGP